MSAINLQTLGDTQKLAETLAAELKPGDVVALAGDLGAGKTAFARFLIQALSPTPCDVTSPTFTLLQTYPIRYTNGAAGEAWHYDLYRIEEPSALTELGLEDATNHLTLIEWPERLGNYPLPITRKLHFTLSADGARQVEVMDEKGSSLPR